MKPELILELEKKLNTTFVEEISDFNIFKNEKSAKYSVNENGDIIGLCIVGANLTDISFITSELTSLQKLYLSNNQISDISPITHLFRNKFFLYNIENNPLKYPPKEIVQLGREAILEYFDQAEKGTTILREAKLIIIGEAGAGKTTFARKIQNRNCPMPKDNEITLGIDVYNWTGDNFNAKLWDFGGQDIYHGTHQFFFSYKSLYVLLSDAREQKTDFNYWLNTIEQLTGEDSPLIILLNKKNNQTWEIDEIGLRSRFGDIIKQVITIDLSNENEIPELQQIITKYINNLPYIGYTLPTTWVEIREKLAEINDKFIHFKDFRNICKDFGITNPKVIEIISKLFTNIGVFTHFGDAESGLKDIVFLDSNWLTKTVYSLLNSEIVRQAKGKIDVQHIRQIWDTDEMYFDIDKFIELLKKFSLLYRINGSDKYIVPEHLPAPQPYTQWRYANEADIYQFRYLFDNYMPRGIMAKLIVALHPYIYDNNLAWKRGVNICNSIHNPDTFAEIIETYGREFRFDIKIVGKNQKDLLNIIIFHFDKILKPFNKLTHEKLVPCNCDTCKNSELPHFYNIVELQELDEFNIKEVRCRIKPFLYAQVKELLFGINVTELRSLLANEKFNEFMDMINQKFADIPYLIHKEKINEGFFHSTLHTILAENGLNPVSEESTNNGRMDIHLSLGQTKYIFELKMDSPIEIAINQIHNKEYYRKFTGKFDKIILIGINFSSKNRNIVELKTQRIL